MVKKHMEIFSIYQEFDLIVFESSKWEHPAHKHNFFELIYITKGSGIHLLNDNSYKYEEGSMFLLTPEDTHNFIIQKKTAFVIISFTKSFFSKNKLKSTDVDFSELFTRFESLFYNFNKRLTELVNDPGDKLFVKLLIDRLVTEAGKKELLHEMQIKNIVVLLLNIVARNVYDVMNKNQRNKSADRLSNELVVYIQHNIYDNKKLRLEMIAENFHKTKNALTDQFKKDTGSTIKNYILDYKLNLAKSRLAQSTLTITEIADELQFTDENHLNKMFKLKYGLTPRAFRSDSRNETKI